MITTRKVKQFLLTLSDQNEELIWANVWHDTCNGIEWMEDMPSISPGRFAVGYNYLYVMTRILDELEPHHVLDLGLGISGTLISKYFESREYDDGMHFIIEHDKKWIDFYQKRHRLSKYSNIKLQELVKRRKNGQEYFAYQNLGKDIKNKKFSVVSIDAPFGGGQYARRDMIEFIPEILEDSFVIIMHDSNRIGEKNTILEIKSVLDQYRISYSEGIYRGISHCCVITSVDNEFICSL